MKTEKITQPYHDTTLTLDQYLQSEGLSRSAMVDLLDCPARYYHNHVVGETEITDAMKFGSLYHCSALEPQQFDDKFYIQTAKTRRGRDWDNDLENAGDRLIIKDWEVDQSIAMVNSLQQNNEFYQSMTHADQCEGTLFGIINGAFVKFRYDYYHNGVLVDLKTISNLSDRTIAYHISDHGYDIQAALGIELVRQVFGQDSVFIFIFQEKKPPYLSRTIQLCPDSFEHGRCRMFDAIEIYKDCLQQGEWPGYSTKLEQITMIY